MALLLHWISLLRWSDEVKLVAAAIAKLMTAAVAAEAPWVTTDSENATTYRASIVELADVVERVASDEGLGQGPDVEAALLSAMLLFESRFRAQPPDGDCHLWHARIHEPRLSWPRGYVPVMEWRCEAFGAMQIGRGIATWKRWLPDIDAKWGPSALTPDMLHRPDTSVTLGRDLLSHWRTECGSTPGYWLTAWGWGNCPHLRNARVRVGFVDMEGTRRCAVATAMLDWANATPDEWICGHEDRRLDPFGARFVKAILAVPRDSTALASTF